MPASVLSVTGSVTVLSVTAIAIEHACTHLWLSVVHHSHSHMHVHISGLLSVTATTTKRSEKPSAETGFVLFTLSLNTCVWTIRASIRHLGHMNVLASACICGPVSLRYRSSETNYQYGYRHKCLFGCLLTADQLVFSIIFYWCNLLILLAGEL